MKKFLLSIFCCLMAVFAVQAESLVYTLEPTTGSNNSYAGNCDVTIDGITWNLTGNSTMIPWRIGGKNLTNVDRALYSKTSIESTVNKVVLTTGTSNLGAVNSAKLLVADNASFTNAVEYSFNFVASSDIEIPVSAAANSFYKFVFNVNAGGSNKYLQFVRAKFYTEGSGEEVITLEKPIISPENTTFNDGESIEVAITAEEGATIRYTLDGNDPTEESDVYSAPISITETTTVKAIAVKDGCKNSEVAEATYTAIDPNAPTATLSFASTDQRVSQDNDSQVWSNEGVTFTNNKASSTTSVANYSNPVRLYKNSDITIETTRYMSEIEFDCNTDAYATVLANSIGGVEVDGDKVTVKLSLATKNYTISLTEGQVRLDAITVTYLQPTGLVATLTVSEVRYATLYLGAAVQIPEGVKAYIVTGTSNGYAMMTEVTGIIPANTGLILETEQGEYEFALYDKGTADVTGNLLTGSLYSMNVEEEAYVLADGEDGVGLYKAEMNQLDGNAWLNNANKAYLPASSVPNKTVEFYGFDWGGTTGIENIEGVAGNNFGEGAIYDLTGRKINSIAVTGIYIIDGKKVFIRK
ncbi:MAG: chitobiase/beta-hexosaminidase C-terminal domain-containing protein [Bacteroidaceae bacterium]|nr:chitobiase/beta-hexosaminidase C-terminal domain-containing protein [Bacteroidaceae bacterium]